MAIIAMVVRLDTTGPIFFRQVRVGRQGQLFKIIKFRTMTDRPVDQGHEITLHHDPRVTRSGIFLRHWKLDELPQLWNVFCGDMSIVGPRPEVPKYVALYSQPERDIVLGVRPGITDPASIKYRSEADMMAGAEDPERFYREVILPDKLALAADYARHPSFGRDMAIILQTLLKVVR
jgi:lipopolysaccharide/colanic/teichoic acid biosynthesis glycosyltransferase